MLLQLLASLVIYSFFPVKKRKHSVGKMLIVSAILSASAQAFITVSVTYSALIPVATAIATGAVAEEIIDGLSSSALIGVGGTMAIVEYAANSYPPCAAK